MGWWGGGVVVGWLGGWADPPPPLWGVGWVVGWWGGGVVGWLGGWVVGWLGGWVVGWLGCGSELVWAWWVCLGLVQGWFRVGLRWVSGGFGFWLI